MRRGESIALIAGSLAFCAALLASFASCGAGRAGVGGEVMLAISTDLVPGKDLDRVDVTVEHRGREQLRVSLPLGGSKGLPATIPITALEGDTDPITVHVLGYARGSVRMTRDAVTTVPDGRTALLYLPLQYLCDAVVCPGGQTCIAGACTSPKIDVTTLPDYAYDKVFGMCLDVGACFEGATQVSPAMGDCSLPGTADSRDNYALRLPSAGTCGVAGCDVALVEDPLLGWRRGGSDRHHLPSKVCKLLGIGAQLVKSTKCPTLTMATPTCQASNGGRDAAAPGAFVSSAPFQPTGSFVVTGSNILFASTSNAVVQLDTSSAKQPVVLHQSIAPLGVDIVSAKDEVIATDGVDAAWAAGGATPGVWTLHDGQVAQRLIGPTSSVVMDPRQPGVVYYVISTNGPLTLGRVSSDGTNQATLSSAPDAGGLGTPRRVVAADDVAVFWLTESGVLDPKALMEMSPATVGGAQKFLTNVGGTPSGRELQGFQVIAKDIYWFDPPSAVKRTSTIGGGSPAVATIPASTCAFAVNETYLYFCDASGAYVVRQALTGGPTFLVAQLPQGIKKGRISAIRLAAATLYAEVTDDDAKSSGFMIVRP